MLSFLARRLVLSLVLVVGLLSAVFFVVHAMPGDPASLVIEHEYASSQREQVRARLGLDRPVAVQYRDWLLSALRGDFGRSLRQQRPVTAVVGEAIGPTLLLTGTAYLLEIAGAIGLGVTMARLRRRGLEYLLNLSSLTLYSLPSFWLGLMAIMVFARGLGWFPVGGMQTPDAAALGPVARVLDVVHHLVLPALVLGLGNLAVMARFVRGALGEVLRQDYILAARARGLSERTIMWRHGLRAVMLPVITLVGLGLPHLLAGAVVIEEVFAWPGMGRVTIQALLARDYPVLMATTALAAVLVVVGNLAADLCYRWADPRVRSVAAEATP